MASFKEAFAAARKAQGAGGEFTWKGNSYSTNIVGETGKKKKLSFSTDMVEKAIDKASGIQTPNASTPRPQPRPTEIAKGIDVSNGGIKVSKLPKDEKGGSGAAGAAAAIGTGAAILASGLKRSGAGGAGRASVKLLPAPPKALPAPQKALPAPQKMIGKEAPKAEAKPSVKKGSASKPVRKIISPKIAPPQTSTSTSKNSRPSGRVGGPMMGDDPMFHALSGGGFGALEDLGREGLINMKKGGVLKMKEGSAKDMREDKAMAKKHGMTMKQHEASAADKKHDAPKKMAGGGVVKKMSIPGTASSSSGNPNKASSMRGESKYQGDLTRRSGGGVVKKASGGSMRGTGAAVRGKGFSGCY